jgi:hypothetical protein
MADLYLSFAAFAYYAKENGYEMSTQGNNYLTMWLIDAKMHPLQVHIDTVRKDCGCIYTNDEDLEKVFSGDTNFVTFLIANCKIQCWGLSSKKSYPCPVEKTSRKKIKTVLRSGETIICKRGVTS